MNGHEARVGQFRSFMSAFCTGVTVVTAFGRNGRPHGLTCTSLTSVTLVPPTLLVCLDGLSGTLAAIREGGEFAVNLLHDEAKATAELFASAASDRFDRVSWQRGAATSQPTLTDAAFAVAECARARLVPVGDHVIVLGEVVGVRLTDRAPLLYGMRTFAGWQKERSDEVTVP